MFGATQVMLSVFTPKRVFHIFVQKSAITWFILRLFASVMGLGVFYQRGSDSKFFQGMANIIFAGVANSGEMSLQQLQN